MSAVRFCGLELAHPIVNGSGTFDVPAARRAFGDALLEDFPFAAFVSKTITLEPRTGNPPPRLWEAGAGLINSIGLPNRGLAGYLEHDLAELARLPVPLITNVMGSTPEEIARLLEACEERAEIAAVELNVSCPNVATGLDIGADPAVLESVVAEVRPRLSKPLVVKLTPNTADVAACAQRGRERRRGRRLADQHAARDGARAGCCERGRASLARRRQRRALRPRRALGGARPGRGGGSARGDPGGGDGRRAARLPCA